MHVLFYCSPENFPLESIRNGNVSIFCNGTEEISLVFGGEEMFFNESAMIVSSRSLLTPWFNITLETATMTTAYMTTQNPSTTNPSSEMVSYAGNCTSLFGLLHFIRR